MTRIGALAVFSARANLRLWTTRVGLLFGLAITALGAFVSLRTGRGWRLDPDLAFYGFLVALIFGLRSGLEQQRESGFAAFLRYELVPPLPYAAAMLGSAVLTWAALCIGAFLALAILSLGDLGASAWLVASWALRSAILMGFVPLTERVLSVRLPFIVPVAVYFLLLIQLTFVLGESATMKLFVAVDRSDPATLLPLAAQAASVFASASLLTLAVAAIEQHITAARRKIVPLRHGGAPVRK
ncbi:MAG: hypothetical protein P8177_12200 [Gemmatimonadota bacterium]|jgi:hypothetical protein